MVSKDSDSEASDPITVDVEITLQGMTTEYRVATLIEQIENLHGVASVERNGAEQ